MGFEKNSAILRHEAADHLGFADSSNKPLTWASLFDDFFSCCNADKSTTGIAPETAAWGTTKGTIYQGR
jgi:hypothetical protein